MSTQKLLIIVAVSCISAGGGIIGGYTLLTDRKECVIERSEIPIAFSKFGIRIELKADFGESLPGAALQAVYARSQDVAGGDERLGVELFISETAARGREQELLGFSGVTDRRTTFVRNANAIVYYQGTRDEALIQSMRDAAHNLC